MAGSQDDQGDRSVPTAISRRRLLTSGIAVAAVGMPLFRSASATTDADNPGRWGFHCHNLYHMATGVITEFRYDGIM
jgi:FtsP/CotA-like multicopper oxidase with cupredoxin domain